MENQKKKKILIIDDEPDVVVYLAALFMDHGFSVIAASTGREGFEKAKLETPDLISLDITMPEETGIRTFWDLQGDSATQSIPVIVITGTPGDFNQLHSGEDLKASLAAYFEKPINREKLIKRIKEILKVN
ncbi:MAG: response regulator [bacterium]